MFSFINAANNAVKSTEKNTDNLGKELENSAASQQAESNVEQKKPVHGEDGVCCGGCGGS